MLRLSPAEPTSVEATPGSITTTGTPDGLVGANWACRRRYGLTPPVPIPELGMRRSPAQAVATRHARGRRIRRLLCNVFDEVADQPEFHGHCAD